MARSIQALASAASILALAPSALAGFNPAAEDNLTIYWGQNSAGGLDTQDRLSAYCKDDGVNIINVSFLTGITNPTTNFANAGNNCGTFAGTNLLECPDIAADIATCQAMGKTILMSIGGATYTEGGFADSATAEASAQVVWDLFGPNTSAANRPFGDVVIDGFDFDFESSTQNFAPFAQKLRSLMDADSSKTWYLSAAPQCVYPDAAMNDMLDGAVDFDWINIQFYNNGCGLNDFSTPNAFNFGTWDNWAKTVSKNPNVKVSIGAPGAPTAAGQGYVDISTLDTIISDTASKYSSFGGVMIWDMSQLYTNPGYLEGVVSALEGLSPAPAAPHTTSAPTTTTTAAAAPHTTMVTSTKTASAPSTTGLAQWAQCGGSGYTGPTQCASPFSCVAISEWWAQCE